MDSRFEILCWMRAFRLIGFLPIFSAKWGSNFRRPLVPEETSRFLTSFWMKGSLLVTQQTQRKEFYFYFYY